MDTNILALDAVKIGEVFTPLKWAKWLLIKEGVFNQWCAGASICDPTAGKGVFALALFSIARENGVSITDEMLSKLSLIEIKQKYLAEFLEIAKTQYRIKFPATSLHCTDVITRTPPASYDILVGNPPWANFTNLPHDYKDILKPYFLDAGLVPDRKAVLLGSARTDIAALVLKVALGKLLRNGGRGYFFVPLSLFTGDDAHIGFRDYRSFSEYFSISSVYEFNDSAVFEGVATSYCYASFIRNQQQEFPIPYFRERNSEWIEHKAAPLKKSSDPWRVMQSAADANPHFDIDVKLHPEQKPRQGVNTCGANDIFIFRDKPENIDSRFIFPLATKENWKESFNQIAEKWIFIPYNKESGRIISEEDISKIEGYEYLLSYVKQLSSRKGTLISSAINKGLWWSLLGVGPYSFSPYKVIWQAFGKKDFQPIILGALDGQPWQANQAMQAFIPCWSLENAQRILLALKNPHIERLLSEMNGQGKCNWAQPGKMKKILAYDLESSEQLALI